MRPHYCLVMSVFLGNAGSDERIRTADLLITKPLHADSVDGTGCFAQETYSAAQPFHMNPVQMGVKLFRSTKLFLLPCNIRFPFFFCDVLSRTVYSWYDEDAEHHALEKNRCVGEGMEPNVRL